jgi:exopolysaccharide biosynthesis polyprenyl glycosylphosphotransferase
MTGRKNLSFTIIVLADIAVFYLSLALGLFGRLQQLNSAIWNNHFGVFTCLLIIWLIINYGMNEYDSHLGNRSTFDQSTQSLKLFLLHIFSGIALFYLLPTAGLTPKTILLIVAAIFGLIHFWTQTKIKKIIRQANFASTNTAIVGNNPLVPDIISAVGLPVWGMKVIAWFSDEPITNNNYVKTYPLFRLPYFDQRIDNLIVADNKSEAITNVLYKSLNKPQRILKLMDVYEQIYQRVPPNSISASWVIDSLAKGKRNGYALLKRSADIVLATACLLITLPLTPLIALMIKLTSQGPIFFSQFRVGYLGREFLAIKFRTWYVGHEIEGHHLAQKNDPRITGFGKLLRAIRLDEIPQLINIVKGDMSFVGPRPERPELVKKYIDQQPLYAQRQLTKPGLTGWAQINQSYQESADIDSKLAYDLYYLKYQSLVLDIKIILKTINTILSSNG